MLVSDTTMIETGSVNVRGIENGRLLDEILNGSERGTENENVGRKESLLIAAHVTNCHSFDSEGIGERAVPLLVPVYVFGGESECV